jgi:hypothetical protein
MPDEPKLEVPDEPKLEVPDEPTPEVPDDGAVPVAAPEAPVDPLGMPLRELETSVAPFEPPQPNTMANEADEMKAGNQADPPMTQASSWR